MAIVSLTLDNFESLILNDYSEDGYLPMSLEEAKENPNFEDLHKLFKACKGDFNVNNCLSLKVEHGMAAGVYGFSLINKGGKAVLQFGSSNSENPGNEVEVLVETVKGEDEEETTVIKAGKATIVYDRIDRTKADSKPSFLLKFGKAAISMYVKLASDDVNASHFDEIETSEDLAALLGSIGTVGVKLTDVVRPYVRQGCKGVLPKPIVLDVLSWDIQLPHPEYGISVIFNVKGLETALRADGSVVKNPGAIFVNSNQVSAQLIQKQNFAEQVVLHKNFNGSLNLVITAVNARDAERNMPTNVLKLVKPSNPVMAQALEKALELYKKGVPYDAIMREVPVPTQNAIAPSKADIFPTATEVVEKAKSNGKVKELVTVAATVIDADDDEDIKNF
jgi:hypothetical protein